MEVTRVVLLAILAVALDARNCTFEWRSHRGDSTNAASSCFTGPLGQPSSRTWLPFPSTAAYSGSVAADPTLGLVVIQTQALDMIAVNASSGVTVWQTFALPGGYAPSSEPLLGTQSGTPRRPTALVSGVADATRGLTYILERFAVYAVNTATGAEVLPLAPLNSSTGAPLTIAGGGSLTLSPDGSLLLATVSVFSDVPGAVTSAAIVGVDTASWCQRFVFAPSHLRSACHAPIVWPGPPAPLVVAVCSTNETNPASAEVRVFGLSAATGATLLEMALVRGSDVRVRGKLQEAHGAGASPRTDLAHVTPPVIAAGLVRVATGNVSAGSPAYDPEGPAVFSIDPVSGVRAGAAPLPGSGASVLIAPAAAAASSSPVLIALTPTGELYCEGGGEGPPFSWSVSLDLPPPGPYAYGITRYGPPAWDDVSQSLWVFAAGYSPAGNEFIGIQVR